MTEPERVELGGMKLGWSERRTEALLARVQGRVVRRRFAARAGLASVALAGAALTALLLLRPSPAPHAGAGVDASARAGSPRTLRLREGSEVRLLTAESEARVAEESKAHVVVELLRGSARYAVVADPARTFEVRAGTVSVRVVGTEFVVERRGERAFVEVARGKVSVSSGDGPRALLGAGESGLFPREPAEPSAATPSAQPEVADSLASREGAKLAYRAHLAQKDYRAAFALLSRHPSVAGDSVQELLQAADVARLSEHPADAVPYLQRIVREHPGDERSPLAAFTLGRTLSGLGRTKEAASMFARVRSVWPASPLAEDALVRQVEAAAALGDSVTAARLADEYERAYPSGRRRTEVRRYAQSARRE